MKLTLSEEQKLATKRDYRTSARTLRRLAGGHLLFELSSDQKQTNGVSRREWDHFAVRNLGLAVQRRMAKDFSDEAARIRTASVKSVKRAFSLRTDRWREAELNALENFALVLAMIPGIDRWSADEKQSAAQIIRAKANSAEARYLRLMQRHTKLRAGIIALGS